MTGVQTCALPIFSKFSASTLYHVTSLFVEDLVRNVAVRLNAHKLVTWYKVEAENFESIHNHNAYACIEKAAK